jgi:cell division protein FtsB
VAGVVLAIVLSYLGPVRGYLQQRSQLHGYEAQLRSAEDRRDHIRAQLRALDNPVVLEQRARELDMIRPGERQFVIRNLAP